MKRWIAFGLCLAALAALGCGCSNREAAKQLTTEPVKSPQTPYTLTKEDAQQLSDLSVKLFQAAPMEDNLLLSPASALCALGMTANGAKGETLSQLEALFGMDTEALNRCMGAWLDSLQTSDGLCAANSVWLSSDIKAYDAFLQAVSSHYGADIYQTAFSQDTLDEINRWVSEKTGGMIPTLLDKLPSNAVAYLINALCFRRAWAEPFTANKVADGSFTTEDGQVQTVQMMSSKEYRYLQSDNATGFMKTYEGDRYAFAALLPSEGPSLQDYIASLDGVALQQLLENSSEEPVSIKLPKFEATYTTDLVDVFRSLGVTDAFDDAKADLSGLGSTDAPTWISRVLHKTAITVNETGTEAAAATAAEIMTKSMHISKDKVVVLDRPFVYMIVDLETNIPVFIGTVTSIGA